MGYSFSDELPIWNLGDGETEFTATPGATLNIDEETIVDMNVLAVINAYKPEGDIVHTVDEQKELVDFDGATYTYYKLSPGGAFSFERSIKRVFSRGFSCIFFGFVLHYR